MELRQLRYFVVAAEERHLGRAAALMHITPAAFRQQISRLERHLGVRLLDVIGTKVRLTAAGEVFVEEARRTLQQADDAADTARRAARGELGMLSIGYVATAARHVLPRLLAELRVRYPGIAPVLHQLWTAEQLEGLRPGRIGMAFVLGAVVDPALRSTVLLQEPFVALLPESHPLTARPALRLDELADEPVVVFRRELNPYLHDRLTRLGRWDATRVHEVDDAGAIPVLVAAGHGIAPVSRTRAEQVAQPGLVQRPLEPAVTAELRMAWRHDDDSAVLEIVRALTTEPAAPVPS